MPITRIRRALLASMIGASLSCTDYAYAQVPVESAVICTYTDPTHMSGTPGLFVVPLAGGQMTRVTGLPPELSTNGLLAYGQGGYSVSIRSSDGAVIVSTIAGVAAPNGGQIELFVLHLNGTTAVDPARTQRIILGTTNNVGRALNRVLPDGRILVAVFQIGGPLSQGPMAGHVLAIVDPSVTPAAFTLLPNPPIPTMAYVGGVAVDPSGVFAYYALSTNFNQSPTTADLHRLVLATGQDCVIASWPGQSAFGITCDDDGSIYVGAYDPNAVAYSVHTVRPDGCNPAAVSTLQCSIPLLAWGLDLHRASGYFAVTSFHGTPVPPPPQVQTNTLSLVDSAGNVSPIATGGAAGWGVLGQQGITVNNAIESYGAPSPGLNRYWFESFPNPGGPPAVCNLGFTLTMRTMGAVPNAPLPMQSALALSFGRGSWTVLGAEILVDPASAILQFGQPGASVPYPLPIPCNAGLIGLQFTAQGLHRETVSSLAASRGLALTLY